MYVSIELRYRGGNVEKSRTSEVHFIGTSHGIVYTGQGSFVLMDHTLCRLLRGESVTVGHGIDTGYAYTATQA